MRRETMTPYLISDGTWDDEFLAADDSAARTAARSWLVDLIDAYDTEAGWCHFREGDEGVMTAGVTKRDSEIDDDGDFEVTITVRRVGGRVVVVE
jgi:hypothetical protein